MSDRPQADIGHNQPNYVRDAIEQMRAALEAFKPRRAEFLAAAAKAHIKDRHDAGDAASLIGMARDVAKLIDAKRLEIGGPYDAAAKAVTAEANEFWIDVFSAMEDVQAKLTMFADEERKRIADQAAEQAAEDARRRAALAPAAAPAPERARPSAPPRPPKRKAYRGDLGHQAIVGDVDVIEIVDVRALPDMILNSERVTEAIIAVLKPMVRNGMAIAGIKTSKQTTTSIRR